MKQINTALTLLCILNGSCDAESMFTQLCYVQKRAADLSSWYSISLLLERIL